MGELWQHNAHRYSIVLTHVCSATCMEMIRDIHYSICHRLSIPIDIHFVSSMEFQYEGITETLYGNDTGHPLFNVPHSIHTNY